MTDLSQLAADLAAATTWPADVRAMEAIQQAHQAGVEVSSLVPALLARLDSSVDDWSIQTAVETLGLLGARAAVERLCAMLGTAPTPPTIEVAPGANRNHAILAAATVAAEEDDFAHSVVQALGRIGDARALPALRRVVGWTHAVERVRRAAQEAIEAIEAGAGATSPGAPAD